jgi:hypothetical protein
MSPIPEFQQRQIERWCARHVPDRLRDEVRVECRRRGRSVTVLERRAGTPGATVCQWTERPVAQLRYGEDGHWTLYWADGDDRWHSLPWNPRDRTLVPLLAEIDRNPAGLFWGEGTALAAGSVRSDTRS